MISLPVSPESLVWEAKFSLTKLALTQWLVTRGWQPFLDDKARKGLDGGFKRFADVNLSRHTAELKTAFLHPLGEKYRDQLPRLSREVHILRLLAGYYDPLVAGNWLETWQSLRHAIETGQRHETEALRQDALSQVPFWLHSGKTGKR